MRPSRPASSRPVPTPYDGGRFLSTGVHPRHSSDLSEVECLSCTWYVHVASPALVVACVDAPWDEYV